MKWETAILKAYNHNGGCADNQKIYQDVEKFIRLTEAHRKPTVYGGRRAYEHQVRAHIAKLVQSADLRPVSRGHYCLTAKGKSRADR
jgi:nicotinic acid phosphoribosyltransferase